MSVQGRKWTGRAAALLVPLVLAARVAFLSTPARSDAMPRVYVWPEDQEVLAGDSGYVELRVDGVEGLFAVELHLTYNSSILDVLDAGVEPGIQIGAGDIFSGLPWHVDVNQVSEPAGTIDYVFSLDSGSADTAAGSGSLARIDFAGLQPGASAVAYVEAILARRGGQSIEHVLTDGVVRVVEALSTPTPTSTYLASPTPTQTPPPGSPVVYVDPATQYVTPGTTSWADLRVADAEGLYGAWVSLTFDPIIEVLDFDPSPGVQLEPGNLFSGKSWYRLANQVDNGAGTMIYGAKLSFAEPADVVGGQLARIHFRAAALGVCPLGFDEVVLTDQRGVSFSAFEQSGVINVVEQVPGSPTPTPESASPTPTPTATSPPTPTPFPTPVLYLEPEAASLVVGGEESIEVRIEKVADLYGIEFHINYDPSIVEILDEDGGMLGTQISFGAFLSPDSVVQNEVDESTGMIHYAVSQAAPTPPRSGEGIVACFRVRALSVGATALGFHVTRLAHADGHSIAHGAAGGLVAVNARVVAGSVALQGRGQHGGSEVKRDGEVLATTGSSGDFAFACPVVAGQPLTLTAEHEGYLTVSRTFVVSSALTIDLGAVTLLGGDLVGPQVQAARAPGCPGEPTVGIPGPPDSRINVVDLAFAASRFGSRAGDEDWEPSPDGCHPERMSKRADANGDGECNIFDVVQVSSNFGLTGPRPW